MKLTTYIHLESRLRGLGDVYTSHPNIEGDSGGEVNIFVGDSIDHCERKVRMNMCLILNSY
jgi:hypothetical protein